jgi:hypothetical protein
MNWNRGTGHEDLEEALKGIDILESTRVRVNNEKIYIPFHMLGRYYLKNKINWAYSLGKAVGEDGKWLISL